MVYYFPVFFWGVVAWMLINCVFGYFFYHLDVFGFAICVFVILCLCCSCVFSIFVFFLFACFCHSSLAFAYLNFTLLLSFLCSVYCTQTHTETHTYKVAFLVTDFLSHAPINLLTGQQALSLLWFTQSRSAPQTKSRNLFNPKNVTQEENLIHRPCFNL